MDTKLPKWTCMKIDNGSSHQTTLNPTPQQAGRLISDPYRWMEEDTPALRAWVQAQHEYTIAQLSSLPAREGIASVWRN